MVRNQYHITHQALIFININLSLAKFDIELKRDGFGPQPFFECLVVESQDDEIIGYCLYFYGYITRSGRSIIMEDILITKAWRNKGIGTALWAEVMKVGPTVQ